MKINLALSGAGSRVSAHLGAMQALLEAGCTIGAISATSAGAVVASLYLNGYSISEICSILEETNYRELISFRPFGIAPFSLEKGIYHLDSLLKIKNLEDLPLPLFVCVCDIKEGKIAIKSTGNIARSVVASSAFLPLFRPIELDGTLYADGGAMDNLPIAPIKQLDGKRVGINANPMTRFTKSNPFSYAYRTLFLLFYSNIALRQNECDLYIEPKGLERYSIFDTSKFKECFEIGYNYTKGLDLECLK